MFESMEIPSRVKDITGTVFGRLEVVGYGGRKGKAILWLCKCECGNMVKCRLDHMKTGRTKSCGCLNIELQRKSFQTHGLAPADKRKRHPLYSVWCGMKKRCYTKSAHNYEYYGGRGIKVCDRWRDDFLAFVVDMGEKPDGYTIERKDNDGDYCPDNCIWADKSTQMRNRRPRSLS